MPEPLKIVAHYNDGRTLRGTTDNFWPTHACFHLHNGHPQPDVVYLEQLKAVFIVRNFDGHRGCTELRTQANQNAVGGRPVRVRFNDGEVIYGAVMELDRHGIGFFLFPMDPNSNNLRIFVVNRAVTEVNPA
ncbi:MAG: hypothetical protein GVY24_06290 [Planctomycetes bacterium]|jgi:hypothetical protein|nr:hypothetical protein [Planctomycetota bacterium]